MSHDHVGRVLADRVWKRFRADQPSRDFRDAYRRLRHRVPRSEWRWVLRDVSLDIAPGDSVALIGANGSGKSTMLKLLAGVMDPYAGRVEVIGRSGALIEVRAGIHQELSGRENIFLSGSLLGLPRRLVADRFDEIVHFADLEDAIDRQTKFYSTGMQMRLGFGVAAFLEPDVLLVDEVLAVGDATFQQRCLDRIRKVLATGTTLVFVSHDLAAVESMCADAVWLRDGVATARGSAREVLGHYRQWVEESAVGADRVPGVLRLVSA
jgi:ABC-type polysaccharide/polyol phosphate transport system ATPase subunit